MKKGFIFLFLFTVMLAAWLYPVIPQAERDALIALYNSTDGDNWYNNTNWRKPGDPTQFNDPGTEHTWNGITLNIDYTHVESISLGNNTLVGTLPDLSDLTELQYLGLGYNQISGTLPTWLNELSNLTALYLHGNQFTGTIPDLSGLTQVQTLWLGSNDLTGEIPASLNNLVTLTSLLLSYNDLSGTIPDLSSLTQLGYLNLSGNPLSGNIPGWLNQLTNLSTLSLYDTQLSGTIPDLSNLTQLSYLYFYSNQLTGAIPTWINQLVNLKTLDLRNNHLSGDIPNLSNLTQLTTLNLSGNSLTGNIPDLSGAASLGYLQLNSNQLTGSIPSWISNLTALRYLELQSNQLSGTIPDVGNLTLLTRLNLSNNQLTGTIPTGIGNLTSLLYLYLNNNQLEGNIPAGIGNLTSLWYLYLDGNRLEGNIPQEIGNLTGLRYLFLKSNRLVGEVPSTLSNLTNLYGWGLDLSWNALYTEDDNLAAFIESKYSGLSWESTQTIAPDGLFTDAIGETTVTVNWAPIEYQAVSGGYHVYYSTTPGSGYELAGTVADKSQSFYVVTDLDPAATYYFVVTAYTDPHSNNQSTVTSGYSMEVSATTAENSTLTITTPNGGESWEGGLPNGITWTTNGSVPYIKLEYSLNNGATWDVIVASIDNYGGYNWTVPNTPSNECLVRVSDASGSASDTSDNVFSIFAGRAITVVSPNGGEQWHAGQTYDITWTSTGSVGYVQISYSTDGGNTLNTISGATDNDGVYSWTVPDTPSGNCLVQILDTTSPILDRSDAAFTILELSTITVTSPNGGEDWIQDTTHDITWTSTGSIGTVAIAYSKDGGELWYSIITSTANTGSYSWTIPDTPSDNCLVRVRDTAGPAIDSSNAVFTISPPRIPQSQRDALIALYNSTNGDNWNNNTNWRKPGDPTQFNDPGTEHTWYGIYCGIDNIYVDSIELNLNQLQGTLPAELSNLTQLRWLDLSFNELTGTIPDLGGLTQMQYLNLTVNQLSGNIPSWLNNLTNLTQLKISDNELTGTIPDLSNLTQLTELTFAFNQLSGGIPAWLNNFTNLTSLALNHNQLTGTIPDLSNLTQLQTLVLSSNQLSGDIPAWLNNFTNLQTLGLWGNQLSGTIPNLENLTQLETLQLSENQLTGSMPAWFNQLTALKNLFLNNNQLSGPIPDLGNLTQMFQLNLSYNSLSGTIPAGLGNLTDMEYLRLQHNQLEGNIPSALGNLTSLKYFYIDGNKLSGEIPGSLSNLANLTDSSGLHIGWNALYTNDSGLRNFLNSKQYGGDWESTQTIAPTGLSTGEEAYDSIKVSWTPIQYQGDGGGYRVYYSTTSGVNYSLAGTTTDKTADNYTVTGLTANTTYYFVVETFTDSHADNQNTVVSDYSEEISSTTLDDSTLTVTAPNGGETWEGNTNQNITWTSTGGIANVMIEYSTDNGGTWNTITGSTANSGSYNWTVPNTPSGNCLVKISNTAGTSTDTSDSVFTIAAMRTITVTAPNGGETWEGAYNSDITWTSTGNIANVMIEYSTDNGNLWNTVIASTANSGSYSWTVPNTPSGSCLVRVSDTAGPAADVSDAVFTIIEQRTITVTAPNGGEDWMADTIQEITWVTTGTIGSVSIEYSLSGGGTWSSITSSTPNTGSFNWTIPDTSSGNCLVRISDTAGPANDTSDSVFTISPPRISQSERDALIALYNSTYGDYWDNNNNWRKPGDPTQFNDPGSEGTWNGITLNTAGTHVRKIILIQNSLSGTLPDLSALTELEELDLKVNFIQGTLPASLNNLTNLKILNLYSNFMESTIPDLSALTQLQTLSISGNYLYGTIPTWINSLTQLTDLRLGQNSLSGTIPDLSNLTALQYCDLGSTQLSGSIPAWFNQLTQLRSLYLDNTSLSGDIPDLSSLTALETCDFSHSQFTGSIPAWLNNLTSLKYLNLGNNQLSGTIPDLSNLTSLQNLTLSFNDLTGTIPAELGNLNALHYLSLDRNRLSGSIPAELGNLTGLWSLRLNGNQLMGSIPTELSNLTALTSSGLSISYNGLYTDDASLRDFLNSKHLVDWESTQTIAPIDLSTSEETFESVKITWTPIVYTGATGGYRVYYSTTSGSDYTLAGTTTNKTVDNYTVTGLNPSTTYYFVVQTITNAHTYNENTIISEYSTEVSAETLEQPTLTVTAPNGGESWEATTSQDITWTSTGNISDVKIEYSTNNGASWNTVIASTANSGSYSWTIPGTTSSDCLIRISDTAGLATDTSDAVFTIAPQRTVTLSTPNGGENWEGGSSQDITWTSTGSISNVKIEYSTDNGSLWNTITDSTANNGSYSWTVPNTPSGNCLVKISDISGPATDTSDAAFTIAEQRSVTVTSPNGGENWEGGANQAITWTSTGNVQNVKIEYSTDNGAIWNTITDSTANSGTYNWTVSNTPSGNCLVKISDTAGSATDTSDAVFTITEQRTITVTAPNNGENWEGASTQSITWTSTGSIANVKIEYSTDNGALWNTIAASAANNGTYNWTVPNTPSSNCLVKISDTAGSATDTSDAVFTITEQRTITVTAPNNGENWEGASTQNITWTSTGSIANVKIEYSTDNGALWNTIAASAANNGTYNWTVPNTPSSNCLVKISDTAGSAADTSDAVFTITEQRTITVTAPNNGENWEGASTQSITWTSTGSIANVKIEYSTDNGALWNTIAASAANNGTYNWTVPNMPSGNCLVKISDTAGSATDTSDAVFTIVEQRTITVTSPNGSERWFIDSTYAITWITTGSIASVSLEYSTNNGGSWNTITSSTANSGSYNWTIPNTPSSGCLVRISDTSGPASDISNGAFTIDPYPTITVTTPDGGESWEEGNAHVITWTYTGTIANVAIDYSTNGGASWNSIASSTSNTGSYSWIIPAEESSNCLVRVSDTETSASDVSNGVFTLWKQPSITVTAPNGGEVWKRFTTQTITWTTTGNIQDVKIQYSTNAGGYWQDITSSTSNDGSYQWSVPNTSKDRTQCLVRIMTLDGTVIDTSDSYFTISKF